MQRGAVLVLVLASCASNLPTHEESEDKFIEADVLQVIYVPPGQASSVGSMSAISRWWGTSATSNTTVNQATYVVIFEGNDGKFAVEGFGKGSTAEALWSKLKEGQRARLKYREVFKIKWGPYERAEFGQEQKPRTKTLEYDGNRIIDATVIDRSGSKTNGY